MSNPLKDLGLSLKDLELSLGLKRSCNTNCKKKRY